MPTGFAVYGYLVVLLSTLSWPISVVVRGVVRGHRPADPRTTDPHRSWRPTSAPDSQVARWLAGTAVGTVVLFLLCVDDQHGLLTGLTTALPSLTAGLALGMVACSVLAWRQGWWSRLGRLHYSAVTLVTVGFVAMAYALGHLAWLFGLPGIT